MRREIRLILVVMALVAGPTAILSFLAARTLRNWDAVMEKQLATAAERTLAAIAEQLRTDLATLADEVARSVAEKTATGMTGEALLDLAGDMHRANPLIQQLIVYRHPGGLVYPPLQPEEWKPVAEEHEAVRAGVDEQSEFKRLLEEARRLHEESDAPAAAAHRYEMLLAYADLPQSVRCAGLLGLAQSRRKAGQVPQAAEALHALLAAAGHETPAQRDAEGYLYAFTARRELVALYAQHGESKPALENALDLMAQMAAHYPEIVPDQRRALRLYLNESVPVLCGAVRGAPGARELNERAERLQRRLVEIEVDRQIGSVEREAYARTALQAITNGRLVDGAEWITTNGASFVFHRLPAPAGWYAGFRVDRHILAQRLRQALQRNSGKDLRLEVAVRPGEWNDALLQPVGHPDERKLAERSLGPPLAGITVAAWPADADALQTGARFQARLFVWGLALLIVAVLLGVWIAVRQATGEMRRASARSDFVADVSHDLRTPLASMRMLAESLYLGNIRDEGTRQKFLAAIVKECDRLSRLTERALYFIRLGQNSLRFDMTEGDLRALIADAVAAFAARFKDGEIDLAVDATSDLPAVRFDGRALTQVVFNLLENAVKYSLATKKIHVTVRRGPGATETQIEVRDYGIGIPPHDRKRIFQRYARGRDPRVAGIAGVGLGLALCRHIVEAHRGRIEVESPPDGGTLFRVILPRAA